MTDQPHVVANHDNDQPLDQSPVTDQRPTDSAPVSLVVAADRLGISVNAVRQRLKRGTLRGEKTATGWVVILPTDQLTSPDHGQPSTDRPPTRSRSSTNQPPASLTPLAELIADLTRQNQELASAAAVWQYRALHAEERLAQLEAGPIEAAAGDITDTAQDAKTGPLQSAVAVEAEIGVSSPAPQESPIRRWWRRVRGE